MPQRSKYDLMTPEEILAEGLRVLKPGQCWRTPMRDLVVAEVLPATKTCVFWATGVVGAGGRVKKTKISIVHFFRDNEPTLRS